MPGASLRVDMGNPGKGLPKGGTGKTVKRELRERFWKGRQTRVG